MSREQKKIARYWALFVTVSLVVFTLALQGCFLDDDDDPVVAGDTTGAVSELVIAAATTPTTVQATSGTLNGTQVVIPVGALATAGDTTITIGTGTAAAPASTTTVGIVIDFGPTGTVFDVPVTITVPYDLALLTAQGKTPQDIILYTSDGATASAVAGPYTIDQVNETISADVTHFTPYWSSVPDGTATGVTVPTDVFLDNLLPDTDYTFMHGSTSPDGSKFLVYVNDFNAGGSFGDVNFTTNLYMLTTDSVTANQPALDTTVTNSTADITGDGSGPQGATITFRSTWTPDGSKILVSGADRFYVLDADTLAVLNGNTAGNQGDTTVGGTYSGQIHDALPTDDGKYAILTARALPYGDSTQDGRLQLYDVINGAPIGEPISVCNECHTTPVSSVLCGIEGSVEVQQDGTYAGTVYVAGHGGHFAEVVLAIDPTNATTPFTALNAWTTLDRVVISGVKFVEGDSQYKLHDGRIDTATNTMYWSTYKTDANGMVHYGSVDLSNGSVTSDVAYAVAARATAPGQGIDKAPIYCASGQNSEYFMPITMTNEAYITVIPKSTITGMATPPPVIYKSTITVPTDVFIDNILPDTDYTFMHGSTSPDGSKFLIYVNDFDAGGAFGDVNFTTNFYMLSTASVTANQPALDTSVTNNTADVTGDGSGPQGATITFRSTWTPDGSKILVSGADRFYVLDADTLAVLNGNTAGNQGDTTVGGTYTGQIHDALPTDDSKYAILTARALPYGDSTQDGRLQLYDVVNGAPIGEPISVCNECHSTPISSVLCGIEGSVEVQQDGTYAGTVYVAGHGGHFAKVDLAIDPTSNTPFTALNAWTTLDRVVISGVKFAEGDSQYKLHDGRIDTVTNTMYWSTYKTDIDGMVHYGSVDLSTDTVTSDVAYAVAARATAPGPGVDKSPIYCASGQNSDYFMPITMTNEAYISVIPKSTITGIVTPPAAISKTTITEPTDVFIDNILPDADYTFMHGSTSPDGSKFLLYVNDFDAGGAFGDVNFTTNFYMLSTSSITTNKPALDTTVTNNTADVTGDGSGPQGATITFRSTWTPDGSKILVSGADRFYVLDADTLAVLNGNTAGNQGDTTVGGTYNGQVHDALPSDDGKYALLTVRTLPYGDSTQDGRLQLYDVVNGAPIGEPVSVCNDCHGFARHAVLCGIEGELKLDETAPNYGSRTSCTVYVAGHGGHIAKINLTVQPENAAEPIVINSHETLNIDGYTKFTDGSSQYKLHDVRLDGTTMYWSTYNTDANEQVHYGSIGIDGTGKVDIAYDVAARATAPGTAPNSMPMYCASGQTSAYFMPITMTNEAYISVIPKSTIQ